MNRLVADFLQNMQTGLIWPLPQSRQRDITINKQKRMIYYLAYVVYDNAGDHLFIHIAATHPLPRRVESLPGLIPILSHV